MKRLGARASSTPVRHQMVTIPPIGCPPASSRANCDHLGRRSDARSTSKLRSPRPNRSTRPSDRWLLPEYGLCGLDEDAQLRRQRCTPRIIKKQSIVLDGALRQQPFEAALADVAARQRFDGIGSSAIVIGSTAKLLPGGFALSAFG